MPVFAAVDIGSNSVRLKIARLARNRLDVLHEDREVTRLGEGVFRSGALAPDAMEHTVRVLRRFHRTAQAMGVNRVWAVATSASRDASNSSVFRQWVLAATGWQLDIISGLEEGRLIHLGVCSALRSRAGPMLLIDVGGGSCEVTRSRDGHIEHMVSLPLGAVRLTQEFLRHDPPKAKDLARMQQFIDEEIGRAEHRLGDSPVKTAIMTSGTAAALAGMHAVRNKGARAVPATAVVRMAAKLARLSLQQRRRLGGINPRRAEIIITGGAVFAQLATLLRLRTLRYSPLGLRDGMLAQMAADYAGNQEVRERIATQRFDSVMLLCKRYAVDVKHAERVRRFAERLFDSLKSVHGLPAEYKEWLAAAAMLYEVGMYVNRAGRYRNAHYIISHSEIFGYTPAQRTVIAAIARYMGGARPRPEDRVIRAVPAAERAHIPAAVALLRVAAALDESRKENVTGVSLRVNKNRVEVRLHSRRHAELELWSLGKEREFFSQALGAKLLLPAPAER